MSRLKKSKIPNLFVHQNGTYYLRVTVRGKTKERSLETTDYNTAAALLAEKLKEMRAATHEHKAGSFAESIRAEIAREDPNIRERTRAYYREVGEHILASLTAKEANRPLPKITLADLKTWQARYAKSVGVTRHNGALSFLRRVWTNAVDARQVGTNIAEGLKYRKVEERDWRPPSKDEFRELVEDVRGQGKRASKATAFAIEFLAFTGLRISEAREVRWKDIRGGHITTRVAKNRKVRRAPLIPAAEDLLARMRAAGVPHGPNDPVLLIKSPRIALANACERLGLEHIRVHDLRHIFATRCLESGVDFPTVAAWLGHKDGGILAAKTYGHLIEQHSATQAGKVEA